MAIQNKMETQPVAKLIFQMSLPPLISMFMQYSYNFIDSAFVARLGEDALTAVSLSFPLTALMIAISIWLGVGVNVLIAQYLGKKEQKNADTVTTVGLFLALICGAVLNILVLLILKPYFRAFTGDSGIYQLCMRYMQICAFMQIPNMVHIMIQKILQSTGNMLAPMGFQIAGCVFNFIFDPILIYGIGVFPAMGIEGAAVSTVLGYSLSMLLAMFVLFGTKQKVKVKLRGLDVKKEMIINVFIMGFPSFVMNALNSFMMTFANIFLAAYSVTAIAFFGAYFKVQQMIVMTVNGLIQGCLPIMSFNYGAGNTKRLNQAFRFGTAAAALFMGLGAFVVIVFPAEILGLFMASEDMLEFGVAAMRIMGIGYIFNGISSMTATYLQASGEVKWSIVINLLRQLVLLVFFMWILSKFMGLTGMWIAFPVTELITFFIAVIIYRRRTGMGGKNK